MTLRSRLAFTVGLVYLLHFAPNVVRETYLAVSLGDRASLRVDEFLGLHPDLFAIEGRGGYINNNPGASFLGAIPYTLARPAIAAVLALKPELSQPKPAATYDDPRPNRTKFLNAARAHGLDVKLGLAAAAIHAGLMVPLAILATLAIFSFVRSRTDDVKLALGGALLYAFATPIFFRSAFLNQNALIAHGVLFGFLAMASIRADDAAPVPAKPLLAAGALLGWGLLTDYSGAPLLVAFGCWSLVKGFRRGRGRGLVRAGAVFSLGALGPLALLFGYQWAAFGHPLFPAQAYMPDTSLSVRGWHGFSLPTMELLWRNLLDPRYGLFAFSPLLALALVAPFRRRPSLLTREEVWFGFAAAAALWLFSSANQFGLLQWNTGVRYLVPATPLLFLIGLPVLEGLSPFWRWSWILSSIAISWSVAMARESVPTSLAHILLGGFELPWLVTLKKTAGAYAQFLSEGASPNGLFLFAAVALWLVWRNASRAGEASG